MTYEQSRDWIIKNMTHKQSIRISGIYPTEHYSNGIIDCYICDSIKQIAVNTVDKTKTANRFGLWGLSMQDVMPPFMKQIEDTMNAALESYNKFKTVYDNLVSLQNDMIRKDVV